VKAEWRQCKTRNIYIQMPCDEHPCSVIFGTAIIISKDIDSSLLYYLPFSLSKHPSPPPHLHSLFPFSLPSHKLLAKPIPFPTPIRHCSLILALLYIPLAIRIRLVPSGGRISGRLLRGRKGKIVVGSAGVQEVLAYAASAGVVLKVGIELLLVLELAEFLSTRGVDVPFGVVVGTAAGDDQGAPADPGGRGGGGG